MNREEYAAMFRVEDTHWWYVSLRDRLERQWRRYAPEAVSRPLRVLDVGCGTGATLDLLVEIGGRFPIFNPSTHGTRTGSENGEASPYFPVGVDMSPDALALCRKRGHGSLAQSFAQRLPFADGAFDAALCFDVVCHRSIEDKQAPLREIRRVLGPGGLLFLNFPAYQWLKSSHDIAVQTDRRFTRREVVSLLTACSFDVLEAGYWNTLLFPAIVAMRLWRRFRPPEGSDLAVPPSPLANRALARLLRCERAVTAATGAPFGLSVFAVGRKTSH